jgi:hypothetical protein
VPSQSSSLKKVPGHPCAIGNTAQIPSVCYAFPSSLREAPPRGRRGNRPATDVSASERNHLALTRTLLCRWLLICRKDPSPRTLLGMIDRFCLTPEKMPAT